MNTLKKFIVISLLYVMSVSNPAFSQTGKSICFYYNEVESIRELLNFDRVVLDPSNVTDRQISDLHAAGITVYSYITVGEYDESLPDYLKDAKRTDNEEWKSSIMDVTSPLWHEYILKRVEELKKRNFDGLFLDTLDSFNAYSDEEEDKAYYDRQVEGLTRLVNDIHSVMPRLIFNRGFEIFDRISFKPEAVGAESVYKTYSASDDSYIDVSASERRWIIDNLNHVKSAGVEAIGLDYLPDSDTEERIKLAEKITALGYTPYVSDGMLYGIGVSFTNHGSR
ncbi:MAG: endo alpha-1,4 polygalactosaminidase [Succinivibrio sp.]|nr:endo alpha-1,4 polygalactosaminidase [Succinivibrio sp.]